jgi:predicted DNA-binding ribbon-helix-helix protein
MIDKRSRALKRSVVLDGHRTSVSLEDSYWNAFKEIAASQNVPIADLISAINHGGEYVNLSSAIRLYVVDYYQHLPMK